MITLTVSQLVSAGLIAVIIMGSAVVAWYLFDLYMTRTADHAVRADWEQEVSGVTMPDWDGQTWDWPENGLTAYLSGELPVLSAPHLTGPMPVAPHPSGPLPTVSGDLPALNEPSPVADTFVSDADFVAALKARTDAYIEQFAS